MWCGVFCFSPLFQAPTLLSHNQLAASVASIMQLALAILQVGTEPAAILNMCECACAGAHTRIQCATSACACDSIHAPSLCRLVLVLAACPSLSSCAPCTAKHSHFPALCFRLSESACACICTWLLVCSLPVLHCCHCRRPGTAGAHPSNDCASTSATVPATATAAAAVSPLSPWRLTCP